MNHMTKMSDTTVRNMRTDFRRGIKVAVIIDRYKNETNGASRKNISLMLHNHTHVDAEYGKWLAAQKEKSE